MHKQLIPIPKPGRATRGVRATITRLVFSTDEQIVEAFMNINGDGAEVVGLNVLGLLSRSIDFRPYAGEYRKNLSWLRLRQLMSFSLNLLRSGMVHYPT